MYLKRFLCILIILSSLIIPSLTNAAEVPPPPLENPERYRAKVEHRVWTDEKAGIFYPTVQLRVVDWQTGKSTNTSYKFPEFAVKMPEGAYIPGNETMSYSLLGPNGHRIYKTDKGIKSYVVYAQEYYERRPVSTKKHTRPVITTLFEFDLETKKLTLLNQVADDELRLGIALPHVDAYQIFSPTSNNFYSLSTNEHLYTLPAGMPVYSGPYQYTMYSSYDPQPEVGDQIVGHGTGASGGPGYYILKKDGTMIETEKLHDPILKGVDYGRYELNGAVYEKWSNETGVRITVDTGDKKETLCESQFGDVRLTLCFGAFSSDLKTFIAYTLIDNRDGKLRDNIITVFDTNKKEVVRVVTDYSKRNYNPRFTWFGNTIIINSDSNEQGPVPYLHLPTNIITAQNDNMVYNFRMRATNSYYNFPADDYITMSDPIEIIVNGKNVHYTGQGTFALEDGFITYVPVRDFVDSIGGKIIVEGDIVTVSHGSNEMKIDLKDSDVIKFAGRSYVKVWDIAPKLGFSVKFEEPNFEARLDWKRYTLTK